MTPRDLCEKIIRHEDAVHGRDINAMELLIATAKAEWEQDERTRAKNLWMKRQVEPLEADVANRDRQIDALGKVIDEKQAHIVRLEQRINTLKHKNAALQPRPEAPASEWGPWEASERIDPTTQTEAAVWGSDGDMVCMVCGGYEGGEFVDGLTRAKAIALLSRAPRAESEPIDTIIATRALAEARAEAAEAERDRLREEVGRLNRLVEAEAGLRRMAGDDKAEMVVELRRLREALERIAFGDVVSWWGLASGSSDSPSRQQRYGEWAEIARAALAGEGEDDV